MQWVGKPLRVAFLLWLGRIALPVSKGKARPFHIFSASSESVQRELDRSVFDKRLTAMAHVGLVKLASKEKFKCDLRR